MHCSPDQERQPAASAGNSCSASMMSDQRIIRNSILQEVAIEQVTTAATSSRKGSKSKGLQQCNTTIDSIGFVVIDLSEGFHLSCHQRDQMGQLLDQPKRQSRITGRPWASPSFDFHQNHC